jgi:NAD(P)H-binding
MSAMKTPFADDPIRPLPHHVAVIGAAGGLGQGILDVCRTEGIGFTAIVRSRPERITNLPRGSSIAVVPSFTDSTLLRKAFSGADAVLTALGVTSTSHDRSALLSANMAADAIGNGALSSLRWTLVRGGVNAKGKDERPVASADWSGALNSWLPVSYQAMGRWMIEEAAANRFVRSAPLVSRGRQ